MTRAGALEEALNTIASTTSDPSSGLYHHRLRLIGVKKGHQPHGEKAWVATFRDEANGHHECVWMSSRIMGGDTFSAECDRVPNPKR